MEWKEVRLGNVCEIYGRIGFRGYTTNDLVDTPKEGAISLSPKNIINGELNLEQCTYIKWDKYYESPEIMINPNEIVITKTGSSVGRTTFVRRVVHPMTLNPQLVVLKNISENAEFLSYYIKSALFQSVLKSIVVGSAIPTLSQKNLANLMINVPKEVEDQRRIASILSSLDRKIELNNKINADLEEMAQAIFKNWFVDFEPFKDGKFVDSELGMIPEGWKIGSYSEMVDSLISGDWGKENPQGNYTHEVACVRGCDFQDINNGVRGKTPQRYILEKNYQAKHLKDKDILVEISGGTATVSTGRTSLVTEELLKKYKHDIVCTNFCKVLRPLSQFSSYVYYSWKYKYDNDIMFGYENGTSGIKNFAIKDFIEKEPVLIPKEQDIVEFQKIIDNLQKQKQIKGTENTTLSLLRDTLLPRLMSGEIEVPQ